MRITLGKTFIDINNDLVKEMKKEEFVSQMMEAHSAKFASEERAKATFENIYSKIAPEKIDKPRKKTDK